MAVKRKTKKQMAAYRRQSEMMRLKWEKQRAGDEKLAEKIQIIHNAMAQITPVLNKVYMAGWHKSKAKTHRGLHSLLSIDEACVIIKEVVSHVVHIKEEANQQG